MNVTDQMQQELQGLKERSNLRTLHTEKYVHIIDELKQKAVDSLPDIIVNYK